MRWLDHWLGEVPGRSYNATMMDDDTEPGEVRLHQVELLVLDGSDVWEAIVTGTGETLPEAISSAEGWWEHELQCRRAKGNDD